ncbi:unnamed protein product [Prorocentrum cordatum]|uniref:Peptidyl-prolyl cis-trans isomerase n=1 Tax=Prorocentrum cordatum TaxID=2364126 RepID=A0ABN9SY13_9DINO|nr:unnamed protein product [Polarella glacialis]
MGAALQASAALGLLAAAAAAEENATAAGSAPSESSDWADRPWLDFAVVALPLFWCAVGGYRLYWRRPLPRRTSGCSWTSRSGAGRLAAWSSSCSWGTTPRPPRISARSAPARRAACAGDIGKLHYKGMRFHRIIPGFVCQGGDCTGDNSIYGGSFADEWASGYIEHSVEGLLSMANAGRDSQTSQFFITLAACHHLDGKHVVFGQVCQGIEVVREMGKRGRSKDTPVVVLDCGQLS